MKNKHFLLLLVIFEITLAFPHKESSLARELSFKEYNFEDLLSNNEQGFNYPKENGFNSLETRQKHPDLGLTVSELITKYGYPLEVYNDVETEDGYLLTVHRIPHGRNFTEPPKNQKVVFLMHGLLCSSADWISMGPEKGLAYILADRGFDVWMGNARGNTHSRKHKRYNPSVDKKNFWGFSWNEIGYYDLPAMIDLVLEKTGKEKIYYVGHSQGTTSFFVMASERPEYNNKIELMQALSPIVFMKNVPNIFLKILAPLEGLISVATGLIGLYEFLPTSNLMQEIGQTLCNDQAFFQDICANVLFLIAGYNSDQLNKTMIPVLLSNVPAGASTDQFFHYAQEIRTGDFKKFDYGLLGNLAKYKQVKPPKYDLSKITAPIALYYGDNDSLADVDDVKTLYRTLKNAIYLKKVSTFNHLDFLWAIDVPELLYKDVISLMER